MAQSHANAMLKMGCGEVVVEEEGGGWREEGGGEPISLEVIEIFK